MKVQAGRARSSLNCFLASCALQEGFLTVVVWCSGQELWLHTLSPARQQVLWRLGAQVRIRRHKGSRRHLHHQRGAGARCQLSI